MIIDLKWMGIGYLILLHLTLCYSYSSNKRKIKAHLRNYHKDLVSQKTKVAIYYAKNVVVDNNKEIYKIFQHSRNYFKISPLIYTRLKTMAAD